MNNMKNTLVTLCLSAVLCGACCTETQPQASPFVQVEKGMFVKRELEGGQMSRDMTLFVDDDGIAYHIYSSEDNLTLKIEELSEDYICHTDK